jgi:hypothetical protein
MELPRVRDLIADFTAEELEELREYIREDESPRLRAGTLNVDAFLQGLAEMREGLTLEEYAEIERAMNEEYVEGQDKTA